MIGRFEDTVGGHHRHLAVLDFGPDSVDGWLSTLAARQFGWRHDALLDPESRTVLLPTGPVRLSTLEFGVLQHLPTADRRPVSPAVLIRHVWGHDYLGGSNVVDAVVRTLRRKLGDHADLVMTIRGVGYRLDR